METSGGKKGVSPEAQALTRKFRDRFVEFVKREGLSEVSKRTGCNYQALRNSVVEGYNPSPHTVFQVKLGYGEEFDEVYVFTGRKIRADESNDLREDTKGHLNPSDTVYDDNTALLREKLYERERQIIELKKDKKFLQNVIKSMQPIDSNKNVENVLREFNDELITRLVYAYRPEKDDPIVTFEVIESSTAIIDDFRTKLRPLASQMDNDDYSLIMMLTKRDSPLYELAEYDFDEKKFVLDKIGERNSADDGEEDPTEASQQEAQNTVEEAKSSLLELYKVFNDLI